MAIDQETRLRAEELFVIDGMTLEDISQELEISDRTLANWSAEGGWKAKRREYRDAAGEIRRYSTLTRLKLIKDAMTSLDPQKIYAFAALEKVATTEPQSHRALEPQEERSEIAEREIKTPQDAINALGDAIEMKLRGMLVRPDALNLGAIKDLKQAMGLLDEMKIKYGVAEKKDKPATDEDRQRLVEEVDNILGVKRNA